MKREIVFWLFLVLACTGYAQDSLPHWSYEEGLAHLAKTSGSGLTFTYADLDTTRQESAMDFDFYFSKKALDEMTNTILADSGLKKIQPEIGQTTSPVAMRIGKLNMKFKCGRYCSQDSIPVISIGGRRIGRWIRGIIFLEIKRSGDQVCILLEPDDSTRYCFTYANQRMMVFSSSEKYNEIIKNTPDRKRQKKGKDGEPSYTYFIGAPEDVSIIRKKKQQFLIDLHRQTY